MPPANSGFRGRLIRVLQSDKFAMLLIVLFQLKVLWGIWDVKDLSTGDSSAYFRGVMDVLVRGRPDIAWSPLYTTTAALFMKVWDHPLMFGVGMRLAVVLCLSGLNLAVLRRLVPPKLAWFLAAWWAVLPINFNSLYEVHLFSCIPTLLSWWVLVTWTGRWGRGVALAIMIVGATLVRNELIIPLSILAVAFVVREVIDARAARFDAPRILKPYLVPILVSLSIVGVFYERASVHFPELSCLLKVKHTLNVSQIYTFGYEQRHLEYTKSPWTDYHELMTKTFGAPTISMGEAFRRNPRAILDHCSWNVSLIPAGLQVLLFNVSGGDFNPDYASVRVNKQLAWALSAVFLGVVGWAFVIGLKNRGFVLPWLRYKERYFCVIAMAASAFCSLVVMIMQRPRPSYLLTLGISLMALFGFSLWRIFSGSRIERFVSAAAPWLMIAAVVLVRPYYLSKPGERRCLDFFEFLKPHAAALRANPGTIVVPEFSFELDSYLCREQAAGFPWRWIAYYQLAPDPFVGCNVAYLLDRKKANFVLFYNWYLAFPSVKEFVGNAPANGWRLIGLMDAPARHLALFQRIVPVVETHQANDAAVGLTGFQRRLGKTWKF